MPLQVHVLLGMEEGKLVVGTEGTLFRRALGEHFQSHPCSMFILVIIESGYSQKYEQSRGNHWYLYNATR